MTIELRMLRLIGVDELVLRMREWRRRKRIRQTALARSLGLHPAAIGAWERGDRTLNDPELRARILELIEGCDA